MTNHYAVLGLGSGASQSAVKAAFREKAKASHPDRHPNDPAAEERFKAASAAYEVLSAPVQRAAHDAELAAVRVPDSTPRTGPPRAPASAPKHRKRRAAPPPNRSQPPPQNSKVAPTGVEHTAPSASAPAPRGGSGWGWLWAALGVAAVGIAATAPNGWDDNVRRFRSRSSGQFRSARWRK